MPPGATRVSIPYRVHAMVEAVLKSIQELSLDGFNSL